MSTSTSSNSGGIGFVGLLTILFIGLKLTDYIDWSWFWVLSPVIFSILLVIAVVTGAAIYAVSKKIINAASAANYKRGEEMKKLLLALLVATPAMATTFADDYKSPSLTPEQALILAKIVQMNGYRCDVINGANRSAWSNGKFTLHCNNWNYSYKIEDKGGRVVVTVE